MRWRHELRKLVLLGVTLGVLVNLPFFTKEYSQLLSRGAIFDEIQIGMSSTAATDQLQHARIWCGITGGRSDECYFSDLTFNYLIRVDYKTNKVVRKSLAPRLKFESRFW